MAISFIHFLALLLLSGLVIRFVETTWPESVVGRSLLYLY